MMCPPAARLGITLRILDPSGETSPAGHCLPAAQATAGSFQDSDAVVAFATGCDVVTVEIEHISTVGLDIVAATDVDVQPTPGTLRMIQDKLMQKEHLSAVGVPLGPYAEVSPPDASGVAALGETFGFPLMLKSRLGAYDGKGNAVVKTAADIESAMEKLGGGAMLYAEQWVPFKKELAVMVARSTDGSVVAHPVVETIQRDNVCHITTTVGISASEAAATQEIAMQVRAVRSEPRRASIVQRIHTPPCSHLLPLLPSASCVRRKSTNARLRNAQAISSIEGAGIYGVELFLLEDGSVVLNEIAPRPHNSGHYTIEACNTCQFEQHLRAVAGLPLGDASLKVRAGGPHAVTDGRRMRPSQFASMQHVAFARAELTDAGLRLHLSVRVFSSSLALHRLPRRSAAPRWSTSSATKRAPRARRRRSRC